MAQPKILLTRIDDRFIYGQDVELWNEAVGSNLVLIVNDEIAADSRKWAPMRVAAPEGVWTRFFSVQRTIDIIHTATPRQLILIMVASPADALALVKGGVPITKISIGRMQTGGGQALRNARSRHRRCRRRCSQRVARARHRTRNPLPPQLQSRSPREPAHVIPWGRRKNGSFSPHRGPVLRRLPKLCRFTTVNCQSPSTPNMPKIKPQVDGSRIKQKQVHGRASRAKRSKWA